MELLVQRQRDRDRKPQNAGHLKITPKPLRAYRVNTGNSILPVALDHVH